MLKTEEEKKICKQYGSHDSEGFVHCDECPLNLAVELHGELACKATHHFDEKLNDWILDDEYEEQW